MNIIIPTAGLGKRFDGYNKPKPLINVLGEPLIFHLLKNLKVTDEDKIFIVYRKELNNFNFKDIINKDFSGIEFIELEFVLTSWDTTDDI